MNFTLALLLAPLVAGFLAALAMFWKEREPRLAAAGLLLPALALRHWASPTPVADSMSALLSTPYAAGFGLELLINLLAAGAVLTLGRSLRERDRAERVQWDSMEAVRAVSEILGRRRGALDEGLRELLAVGCQRLELEFGVHARIEDQHYSVIAVHGVQETAVTAPHGVAETAATPAHGVAADPVTAAHGVATDPVTAAHGVAADPVTPAHGVAADPVTAAHGVEADPVTAAHGVEAAPLKPGDVFELSQTFCQKCVEARAPIAIESASATPFAGQAAHQRTGFEAYLGVPVRAGGAIVGTLYFASRKLHRQRFTGVEKQLVGLMADWLGNEIERERLALAAATQARTPEPEGQAGSAVGGQRLIPRRDDVLDRRKLDVNAAIAQLEEELRKHLGEDRELELVLDATEPWVRLQRHEFDRVLWSLFWHALDARPETGDLRLTTTVVSPPPEADAEQLHFVLLTLSVGPPGLDAPGLAKLFEDRVRDAPVATREGCLSLPRAERLLRAVGGDLSVHSDPDSGTTLGAYLLMPPSAPREVHGANGQ